MDELPSSSVPPHAHEDVPKLAGSRFPVAGLGASSGGLVALQELFDHLPADTGMAFVVVQHLAPDRDSQLAKLLSTHTSMGVTEVSEEEEAPAVEPNHIYVLPSGHDMVMAAGRLELRPHERESRQKSVDVLFRSLARELGHLAVGVVLSGSASDGTAGLKEIKSAGGFTLAQNDSAQSTGMPHSAVAAGCVDFVLSPPEIASELARIARHLAQAEAEDEEQPGHQRIADLMHRATGVDFTHYKSNTLRRRIIRRMTLHRLGGWQEYEDMLLNAPEEIEALYQEILIGVTCFFRDADTFDAMAREVFPKLIADCPEGGSVRIWTAGCATGEEAYSLAMAFTEYAEAAGSKAVLTLLATDVNPAAIEKARAGLYSVSIENDVTPERLRRFFTREGLGYRVRKDLRERCIFSRHDVLSDPPFSRIQFVTCRNLLIYLTPVLQQRVMSLFHYSLIPGGWLWLGSSESVGPAREQFEAVEGRHKLFVRRPGGRMAALRRGPLPQGQGFFPVNPRAARDLGPAGLPRDAERLLLNKYAPPGVVITSGLEIVQFQGDTGAFLSPAPGAASMSLFNMLREGLTTGVRDALQRAEKSGTTIRTEGLKVRSSSGLTEVAVEVIPLRPGTPGTGFIVLFEEAGQQRSSELRRSPVQRWWGRLRGRRPADVPDIRDEEIQHLMQELTSTREALQVTVEQYEAVNEELQAANEEAQSANEELQSINEELETSKEESEATNEELAILNDEMKSRNAQLSTLNSELQVAREFAEGVVRSVRLPLIVLSSELKVRMVNRYFCEHFHVTLEETEGRSFCEIGSRQWDIEPLRTLLDEVRTEKSIEDFELEHHFEHIGRRKILINAQRVNQTDEAEPFIILVFEDITERRQLEAMLVGRALDLQRADTNKNEFLAMLAHELRNPLAPMRNVLELLRAGSAGEEREQTLNMLDRQISNMSRMVDDLLDVSRITEGRIELRMQPVELEPVLTAAAAMARLECPKNEQTLTISIPSAPVYLLADRTRLEQVFGNLLNNACKYSGKGSHISLIAEFGPTPDAQSVTVRVKDDGAGISPDLLPRIFDLFVQASRTLDRAHGGLGIGLTLVQRLVKLHGGSVEAFSEGPGTGSEFVVRLPIIHEAPAATPQAAASANAKARRILVVDDNADSARSLALLQSRQGHETRTAFTGPAGLAAAREFRPDVILLDIGLPEMNGLEVARAIRSEPALADVFLVAMSGYGAPQDRQNAIDAGFNEYMVKPADLRQLNDWIMSRP